jgi:type I restriction enzyme R subunit
MPAVKKARGTPALAARLAEATDEFTISGDAVLDLAMTLDSAARRVRPDGWRGHQARENMIKGTLLPLLNNDVAEVERIFLIIKAQGEY